MSDSGFRPLAGFWFLKTESVMYGKRHLGFPSPCGVLVLKVVEDMIDRLDAVEFPSPCGVLVLKVLFF